jgi:hypothetical protein
MPADSSHAQAAKEGGMTRSAYFGLIAFAITALALSSASAAPVALGESLTLPSHDAGGGPFFEPPTGELLASDTRTLDFTYIPGPHTEIADGREPKTSLQLSSEVRRDPASGKLSFYYGITPVDDSLMGREDSTVSIKSFAAFATDVTAENTSKDVLLSRSLEGGTVTAEVPPGGGGYTPSVAVATDASQFDRNGSLTISLLDEFGIIDTRNPDSGTTGNVGATATFGGVFEPVSSGGDNGGGTPIPLPSAVSAGGLLLLASLGAITRR